MLVMHLVLGLCVTAAAMAMATPNPATELAINGLLQRDAAGSPFPASQPLTLAWVTPAHTTHFEVQLAAERAPFPGPGGSGGSGGVSWSSGTIRSNGSLFRLPDTVAAGFTAGASYRWRVQVSPGSGWSAPALFEVAPSAEMWAAADWIGGASEVATELEIDSPVVRARAYASGLGSYKLHINGKPVDDHLMDPGEAVYDQKVLFVGHNVTAMLKPGINHIAAQIGNSKWGYLDIYANRTQAGDQSGDATRAFRMVLTLTLLSGKELTVTTNAASWKARHGPIVYDHLWHGEIYDQRQENSTWSVPAKKMTPKAGRMFPQLMPPIRVTKSFAALATTPSVDNSLLVDFGQNMAGVATLVLSPPPRTAGNGNVNTDADANTNANANAGNAAPTSGTAAAATVAVVMMRLKHVEILDGNDDAYNNFFPGMEFNHASKTCDMKDWYDRKWYECANQTDGVVFEWPLTAPLTYTPTFTYHGFRYIQLTAVEVMPDGTEVALSPALRAAFPFGASLTAHRAHSDVRALGGVNLAQPADGPGVAMASLLGQTFNATIASHISNLWSIPTDCPQREKRGWMGDAGITSSSLSTFYDSYAFHANFLRLIVDNQLKGCGDQPTTRIYSPCKGGTAAHNGSVPDVTPFATGPYGGSPGSTDWQVTFVTVARNMLFHYGELAVPLLAELYPRLVAFMDYLDGMSDPRTGLLLDGARGDWIPPVGTIRTSTQECAAFWHTLCLGYMSEIAAAVGKAADAEVYATRLGANRAAYHRQFYTKAGGAFRYGQGSQCSLVFALYVGAVPAGLIKPTVELLAAAIANNTGGSAAVGGRIRDTRDAPGQGQAPSVPMPQTQPPPPPRAPGPHLEMGIFGTTFVFDVLQAHGHDGLGLAVLGESSYPSLGYMIANGATTLWEAWDGDEHTIGKGGTSRNHIMFGGGVNRFIAAAVGGLGVDARPMSHPTAGSAWRRLMVHPSAAALRSLDQASAFHKTPRGEASVSWRRPTPGAPGVRGGAGLHYVLNLTVPHGSTADVRLPLLAARATVVLAGCEMGCGTGAAAATTVVPARVPGEGGCTDPEVVHRCEYRSHDDEHILALEVGPGQHTFVRR